VLHGKNLQPFTGAVFVNLLQAIDTPQENPCRYGASVSASFNLRYPGQYFDKESNLHYNWMRSYRAQDGRYTQADPIDLQGGWNKFAYAYQNPLSYTDTNGLQTALPGFIRYTPGVPNVNPQSRLPPGTPAPAANQAVGATVDFLQNYNDMRSANTIGADKYFHCKANCEASRRGRTGNSTACTISDAREWFDQTIKGDPASASEADQAANTFGRSQSGEAGTCDLACGIYRPNGLNSRY
jgi:RHS repeat-associated protein